MRSAILLCLLAISQCSQFMMTQKMVDDKCMADVQSIINAVVVVANDIQAQNWQKAETDAMAVIPLVLQAKTDCLSHPTKSIDASCVADIEALVPIFTSIYNDIKAKNYVNLLTDAESLFAAAEKMKTDCFASKKMVDDKCMADVQSIINAVVVVANDIQAQNWQKAETDAMAVIPLVLQAKTDCLSHPTKSIDASCVADIEALVPIFTSIYNDIKAKNYVNLMADAESLFAAAEKMKTDCFASKKMVGAIDATCIKELLFVGLEFENVVADVENFNIAKAISDIEAIVPDCKKAIADCESSSKRASINIGAKCITDATKMVADIGAIVIDVEQKKWGDIFIEAKNIVDIALALKTDCSA